MLHLSLSSQTSVILSLFYAHELLTRRSSYLDGLMYKAYISSLSHEMQIMLIWEHRVASISASHA